VGTAALGRVEDERRDGRRQVPPSGDDLPDGTQDLGAVGVLAEETPRAGVHRAEHLRSARVRRHDEHAVPQPDDLHDRGGVPHLRHVEVQQHDAVRAPPAGGELGDGLARRVEFETRFLGEQGRQCGAVERMVFDHPDRDRGHRSLLGGPVSDPVPTVAIPGAG
jgi:hypothetical protein